MDPGQLAPEPRLAGNTLRQVVYGSIAGDRLRVRLSNAFGDRPVAIRSAHVALALEGSRVDPKSRRTIRFDERPAVEVAGGAEVSSDPLEFSLPAQARIAVTLHLGAMNDAVVTGHPGSRATSYLKAGDAAGAPALDGAVKVEHWYLLAGIDVEVPLSQRALVVLGDSITDGRGSTTDGNDRWPDVLSRRLRKNPATAGVAVLNLGIGGNAVLSGGLGPPALERFERDVLRQPGARWVVVLQGVNDIGSAGGPDVADRLIEAYERFIDAAHARGLRAYGAPILPFGGSFYDSPVRQAARRAINRWIRSSGRFDAVIDLDAVVRDEGHPERLRPAYDTGDHLHLNARGLRALGDAVDLALFEDRR